MQHLGDGGLDALVGVGDHQLDAAKPAARELAQELGPERLGLGRPNIHAQNLAPAITVDADRDDHRNRHNAPALAHLQVGRVDPQKGQSPSIGRHKKAFTFSSISDRTSFWLKRYSRSARGKAHRAGDRGDESDLPSIIAQFGRDFLSRRTFHLRRALHIAVATLSWRYASRHEPMRPPPREFYMSRSSDEIERVKHEAARPVSAPRATKRSSRPPLAAALTALYFIGFLRPQFSAPHVLEADRTQVG